MPDAVAGGASTPIEGTAAGRGISADGGGPAAAIRLEGVSKVFALGRRRSVPALAGVDLAIGRSEFVAVVGPSGCGKSTLLRLVASLEEPTSGAVHVAGRSPRDAARAHRVGVVFQQDALLPWLNAWSNVALPFRLAGRPVDRRRVDELLALVGISDFAKARPRQLSGGMKQRVALARALALDPAVLLLDEPLASLDALSRRELNVMLERLWASNPVSTVLVTHSVDEAVFLADRVVVLSPRPGSVRLTRSIEFARPRPLELMRTPEFHAVTDEIMARLDRMPRDGSAEPGR